MFFYFCGESGGWWLREKAHCGPTPYQKGIQDYYIGPETEKPEEREPTSG